jgi:hypothetical protein
LALPFDHPTTTTGIGSAGDVAVPAANMTIGTGWIGAYFVPATITTTACGATGACAGIGTLPVTTGIGITFGHGDAGAVTWTAGIVLIGAIATFTRGAGTSAIIVLRP